MKRVIKQKMEDGSLQVVSQSITVPIAEWQALKKKVEEGTLYNSEETITESGTWIAPVTGWYEVTVIGGGGGSTIYGPTGGYLYNGISGGYLKKLMYLEKGQDVSVTIGAGGLHRRHGSTASSHGGLTTFGEVSSADIGAIAYGRSCLYLDISKKGVNIGLAGTGIGGSGAFAATGTTGSYGCGGSAGAEVPTANQDAVLYEQDGTQGAVIVRWYDPDKL